MPATKRAPPAAIDDLTLLRLPDVLRITGYGRTSIYNLMHEGRFPLAVKLAEGGAVAWRLRDVRAWVEALPPALIPPPRRKKKTPPQGR